MTYKYAVFERGSDRPCFNACVYATAELADAAGRELLSRWFLPTHYQVYPSCEPANYTMVDGQPRRIAGFLSRVIK